MAEPTVNTDPQQINVAGQYPTATRVEDGVAYDVSGKALGPVSEQQTAQPTQTPQQDPWGVAATAPGQTASQDPWAVTSTQQMSNEPGQPGYFQRLGESVGAPTTAEQGIQTIEHEVPMLKVIDPRQSLKQKALEFIKENTIDSPAVGYVKRNIHNLEEANREQQEAAKNISEGGPFWSNLGKGINPILKTAVESVPLLGEPTYTAGEDIVSGNYKGAAGGLTGVVAQVIAPELMERGGEALRTDMGRLDTAVKSRTSAERVAWGRKQELDIAHRQVNAADVMLDKAREAEAAGAGTRQQTIEAENNASEARANARKAQEAAQAAEEAHTDSKLEVNKLSRRIYEKAQKATAPDTKSIAGAEEDFRKIAPPTEKGPAAYTDKDYQVGRRYLEEHHQNIEQITNKQELYDALDHTQKSMENQVQPYIEKYAHDDTPNNVLMDVRDQLAESPRADFVDAGMNHLLDQYPQLANDTLTVAERDSIRADLNAQNRAAVQKTWGDIATALKADPEFAARYHAADALRNGLYDYLEDRKVTGVRELRQDEASIIRLRNAVQRGLTKGKVPVRGSGESGPIRKAGAWVAEKAGAGIGAKVGGPKGAMVGSWAGEKLGKIISPGDLTQDQLVQRMMKVKGGGVPTTQIVGPGLPGAAPKPFGLSQRDMIELSREQGPLHAELATHYGEPVDASTYGQIEKRFMDDIADKQAHGVSLEAPEKQLLKQINQANAADAVKAREAAQQEALSGKTIGEYNLPQKVEPVMEAPGLPHGLNTREALMHDLAHVVVGSERGLAFEDGIRSHLHPENVASGNKMTAPINWEGVLDAEGNVDYDKLAKSMPDLAATYVAGGVANDLFHDVPFTENHGLGADMRALKGFMKKAGFSELEASQMIAQAAEDAATVLSRPGMRDILEGHAALREAGLSDKYHFSPERIEQVLQDIKEGTKRETTARQSSGTPGEGIGRTPKSGAGAEAEGKNESAKDVREKSEGSSEGKEGSVGKPAESSDNTGKSGAAKPDNPAFSAGLKAKADIGESYGNVVLEDEHGRTAGVVGVTIDRPNQVAQIHSSLLADEYRGKGNGGEMYEKTAEQLKDKGIRILTSDATGSISPEAQRMWDRLSEKHPGEIEKIQSPEGKIKYRWDLTKQAAPQNLEFDLNAAAKRGIKERTTGNPEFDKMIKDAGMVPSGSLKADPESGLEAHALFTHPETGSTMAAKFSEMSPEKIQQNIAEQNAQYAAAKTPQNPAFSGDRVSTRVPEGKAATENHLEGEPLSIDRNALAQAPRLEQKFAKTVSKYPGVKIPENLKDPVKINQKFVDHVADNLKFLYNQVEPEKQVANAKWYESANKLAKQLAQEHNISESQASGVIATQSPQKDWDMNVSLARRIADIYTKHQDTMTSPEMIQKGNDIVKATGANKDLAKIIPNLEGKTFGELTDPYDKAAWVRLYDEAHNPRDFHYIDPGTGENHGYRTNADGSRSKIAWGSLPQIDNALSILQNGSRENVSERLGGMHKVRNFYNNIIDPSNPNDVTIDTHAVAAGLIQPLGGSADEVLDNFGSAGKHAGSGTKGTYPLYADAYRKAAGELGIKARELQSVVWEHVREMFPSEWKSPENEKLVKSIWKKYSDGKQSLNKTRQQILDLSEQAQKQVADAREAARQKAERKQLDKTSNLGHTAGVEALLGGTK